MSRRARIAVVLLVSLLPHLPGLASPLMDYHLQRQTETATVARNYYEQRVPFLSPRVSWNGNDRGHAATELPLYTRLVGLLWPLFGLGDLWGRIVSVVCSSLTALVLFLFLERLLAPGPRRRQTEGAGRPAEGPDDAAEPAFYAACLFSLVPVEIFFGRTVQPDPMALLASMASLWALDRYLTEDVAAIRVRGAGWWAAGAALAAAAIALKIPYVYLVGVCAALAWSRLGRACLADPLLWLFAPLALAPAGLWYRYADSATAHLVPTSTSTLISMLDYSRHPAVLFRYGYFLILSRFPEITTTYPGLVLLVFGMRECLRRAQARPGPEAERTRRPRQRRWTGATRFLPLWWLCVWLDMLAGGGYTYQHEYTALPFVPVNAAIMGLGLGALLRRAAALAEADARRWARLGLAALVAGMPLHAALRIKHWYRLDPDALFLLRLRPVVARLSAPDDLFLCNYFVPAAYLYFIDRRGWSWDVSRMEESQWPKVEAAIARGAKYFLTAKDAEFRDASRPVARRFFSRYPVVYDGDGALIFRLTPRSASGYNSPSPPSVGT